MGMSVKEMVVPPRDVYTYADYVLLPEGAPYQLIGGHLVMTPAPGTFHQAISIRLQTYLYLFAREKNLGMVFTAPIDVYLEETETYQPDILFISRGRLHIIEKTRINGAPDLVVEIISPSTGYYDLKKKARSYARHGVKEYWLVDPEDKSIEIHQGQEGKFILNQRAEVHGRVRSLVLAGLEVEAEDIFAPIA
ncbi:MAG: Uma2 family endonuclease [Clostridia bacterium]|nr:MAG: Uma2 family endonuclease [Clostridia bacterium]